MRIRKVILCCIAVCCFMCGCTAKKDEYFSEKGHYVVECLNTESKSSMENENYYFTEDKEYYFVDNHLKICRYSFKEKKTEVILKSEDWIYKPLIYDKYIYYYNDSEVYRYDMEMGKEQCIFSDSAIKDIFVDIYDGFLYIGDNSSYHTYRCPIDGIPTAEYEDIGGIFPKEHRTDEIVQISLDGLTIEGYYDKEEQAYCIISMREKDTNRRVLLCGNTEVKVDGKRVSFNRDRKTDDPMPYSYQVEGEEEKKIACFEKDGYSYSDLYEQYLYQERESTIIGLISISGDPRVSAQLYQDAIQRDMLFSLNIDTGESRILYDTQNNLTRIIGYDNGIIYLFKDDYKIYSQPLAGGETTQIMSIPRSDDVVFDWCGDYLIVRYRDTCTSTGIRPEYEVKAIEIQS